MKGKDKLIRQLNQQLQSEVLNSTIVSQRMTDLAKYGLSKSFVSNYVTLRENIASADDLTLYYFTITYLPGKVKDFFLPAEIATYKKIKLHEESLDSEIVLRAIQVTDNQWSGRISAKELMKWRNAQIINYNENAQRSMKHIISRGRDFYQIALNQNAVNSIADSLLQESFIPNTLTFNVPETVEIHYDDESATLSFNLDGQMLDILDGYHRYIAISKASIINPNFDYQFEIRIVQFSTNIAQQFIWQEDQKTKMQKIHSDAMNQHKLSNQITQRVNENPNCDFYNNITTNGIINKGYFSAMVHQMYCKRVAKKNELLVQKQATNELVDYLNWLASIDDSYLSKTWDKRIVYSTVYLAARGIKDVKKVHKLHRELYTTENLKYLFARSEITANDIKGLDKIVGVKGGK